jgi:hypothetical protein
MPHIDELKQDFVTQPLQNIVTRTKKCKIQILEIEKSRNYKDKAINLTIHCCIAPFLHSRSYNISSKLEYNNQHPVPLLSHNP